MKTALPYILLPALMLPVLSCTGTADLSPEDNGTGGNICFMTDIQPPTRAEITDAGTAAIYVTETRRNAFGGILPLSRDNAINGIWNTGVQWQAGEYTFFGYTYSPDSGNQTGNGSSISGITNNGQTFHIIQPASGTGVPSADGTNSAFADYLLSYLVHVDDGSTRPLVTLGLVHATAAVELHFVKPAGASDTRVISASVNNVRYEAGYSLTDQTENSISWNCTLTENRMTDYTRENTSFEVPEITVDGSGIQSYFPENSLYFSFLTVQQPVDDIITAPVSIDVVFTVDEDGETLTHNASFSLDEVYGVSNWMAGTKTRYAIVLDTEARIYGTIASWKEGGDMEGTLVP